MKVILFGASKGGENYIANHPDLEIVAFVDNDASKHGTMFMGFPIIAPESIASHRFDNIVITSQWVDQIYRQLTEELKIPTSKIVSPNKQAVKASLPFEDGSTLAFAQVLLRTLNRFFNTKNISVCLDSGTLLGAIRDNALIAWDDDIDLAIDRDNFERLQALLPELFELISSRFNVNWEIVIISVDGIESCINIEFTNSSETDYVLFDISIQRRESKDGYSELLSSGGLFFAPAKHFERFEHISFLDDIFYAPCEADAFLTFMYGEWQTPQKTTHITEYKNRRASMPMRKGGIRVTKRTLSHEGFN
ncbi:LicD family protein [Alteromonas sp. A079]|uniref:LicD family protein n=1 Tax=Alteromonas sp. A079 TaxID=3410268 RepID=UPI003BA1B8BE